jgi:hypothetical protein
MCGCMGIGRSGQRRKVTSGGSGWDVSWRGDGGGVSEVVGWEGRNKERVAGRESRRTYQ